MRVVLAVLALASCTERSTQAPLDAPSPPAAELGTSIARLCQERASDRGHIVTEHEENAKVFYCDDPQKPARSGQRTAASKA